jgi:hypothetical protein
MINLIYRKHSGISKSRALLIILVILLCSIGALTTWVSVSYRLSPLFTASLIARQSMLTGIEVLTSVYDPCKAKEVIFRPEGNNSNKHNEALLRLEEFLSSTGNKESIRLIGIQNETIIKSKFEFSYQPQDEPKLAELRKTFKLDEVVASARNELEVMVLLRNWTRSQLKRCDYQPFMENFDALQILNNKIVNINREPYKSTQFRPCHLFPMLYSQVLLSMGYEPRLVRISKFEEKGYDGHGMVEVWSNQFNKWISMDVDQNIYYEKDGIPLNLLEVHNERYNPKSGNINIVRGVQTSGDAMEVKQFTIEEMIPYHTYFQIVDMRNDWMTNHYFKGHPRRSDSASLFWVDQKIPAVFNFKPKTSEVEDFYWSLNRTEIWANEFRNNKELVLAFKTFTPYFRDYEVTIDNGEKLVTASSSYVWQLHPGKNRLTVKSINQYGIAGVSSWVELEIN